MYINLNYCDFAIDFANNHMRSAFKTEIGNVLIDFFNVTNILYPSLIKTSSATLLYRRYTRNLKKCQLLPNNEDQTIKKALFYAFGYKQLINEKQNHIYDYFKNEKNKGYLHFIWATNKYNPKQIPEKYLSIIKNSLKNIKTNQKNIKKYLWINEENILEETILNINVLDIEIKIFNETASWKEIEKATTHLINNFHFGVVSDLMRCSIIYDNGGIYMDLDYVIINDFSLLLYNGFFISYGGTSTSFMGSISKQNTFFSTIKDSMITSVINLNKILYYNEECYSGCDIAHNLGPHLMQVTYDYYPSIQKQINSNINEKYPCMYNKQCINVNDYLKYVEETYQHLNDIMNEINYCIGYNEGHHNTNGGISWCMM